MRAAAILLAASVAAGCATAATSSRVEATLESALPGCCFERDSAMVLGRTSMALLRSLASVADDELAAVGSRSLREPPRTTPRCRRSQSRRQRPRASRDDVDRRQVVGRVVAGGQQLAHRVVEVQAEVRRWTSGAAWAAARAASSRCRGSPGSGCPRRPRCPGRRDRRWRPARPDGSLPRRSSAGRCKGLALIHTASTMFRSADWISPFRAPSRP